MGGKVWSEQELNTMQDYYFNTTKNQLQQMLPNRTWHAVLNKGPRIGLAGNRINIGQFEKGFKRSEESIRKQSKRMMGEGNVSKRLDVREKISRILKGQPHPWARGELSHRWRGGYEPYYGPNWLSQKRKTLERDKYTCQSCESERKFVVHHIIAFRAFGREHYKEANKLSNLLTLCEACHTTMENGDRY